MKSSFQRLPKIVAEQDYDGYFESLVRTWIERKEDKFKHQKIIITAGPWRPYAVTYVEKGYIDENGADLSALHLDFYSALRTGFGELTDKDIDKIIELL